MSIAIIGALWGFIFYRSWRYGLVIDDVNRKKDPIAPGMPLWDLVRRLARGSAVGYTTPKALFVEHMASSILHLIATLLVYANFGVYAALLFLSHPNALHGSVWLNGKRYVIGTIIALLALKASVWCPVMGALGLFAGVWQASTTGAGLYAALHAPWYAIAVAILYIVLSGTLRKRIHAFKSRAAEIPVEHVGGKNRWILSIKIYGMYFWYTLFPRQPAFFYPEYDGYGRTDAENAEGEKPDSRFLLGIFAIVLSLFCTWYAPVVLWFSMSILPYCHILRKHVVQAYSERYMYCASIGIFAVLGNSAYISLPLIGWYLAKTLIGIKQYENLEEFLHYNFWNYPSSWRAAHFLALCMYEVKDYAGAMLVCRKGLKHNIGDFDLVFLMGKIHTAIKRASEAKEYFEYAKALVHKGKEKEQLAQCDAALAKL